MCYKNLHLQLNPILRMFKSIVAGIFFISFFFTIIFTILVTEQIT